MQGRAEPLHLSPCADAHTALFTAPAGMNRPVAHPTRDAASSHYCFPSSTSQNPTAAVSRADFNVTQIHSCALLLAKHTKCSTSAPYPLKTQLDFGSAGCSEARTEG